MADEILRSKHAFGSTKNLQNALDSGKVDQFDVLFLDGDTNPKIGWVNRNGDPVIVDTEKIIHVDALPESGEDGKIYIFNGDGYFWDGKEFVNLCKPTDLTELEAEIDKKANAEEVDVKINESVTEAVDSANAYTDKKFEAAMAEHLVEKYEICDVPEGTLVKINESEIRIMCPNDTVFEKQTVGNGGDPDCYYATFKVYVPNDNVVGYIEHLGNQVDSEIQNTFSTDEHGRRYQTTWLALAKYDETTGSWNYYGKNSSVNRYIGWDFQIDWYDANNEIIVSDTIRISLSNENCHFVNEPYYVGNIMKEVDTRIEEKIAEVEAAYEIVEF